jgi:hypothetical protein
MAGSTRHTLQLQVHRYLIPTHFDREQQPTTTTAEEACTAVVVAQVVAMAMALSQVVTSATHHNNLGTGVLRSTRSAVLVDPVLVAQRAEEFRRRQLCLGRVMSGIGSWIMIVLCRSGRGGVLRRLGSGDRSPGRGGGESATLLGVFPV